MTNQIPVEVQSDEPTDEGKNPSVIRLKQCRTIRATGARLNEARELCNMSLSYAAEQLGYSNPSKLSKVENASDGYPIPLWLVVEASKLYEVSTDFLLGASGDWERSARMTQEREVSRFQAEKMEIEIRKACSTNYLLHDELAWASGTIVSMTFSMDEIAATLDRVKIINPELWQEVKGGVKLEEDVRKSLQVVEAARAGVKRYRRARLVEPQKVEDEKSSEEVIRTLVAMSPLHYYQSRKNFAKLLGVTTSNLDRLVSREKIARESTLLLKNQLSWVA